MKEARHKRSNVQFHLYRVSSLGESIEIENRLVVAKGLGRRGKEERLHNDMEFLSGVIKMFWNLIFFDCSEQNTVDGDAASHSLHFPSS